MGVGPGGAELLVRNYSGPHDFWHGYSCNRRDGLASGRAGRSIIGTPPVIVTPPIHERGRVHAALPLTPHKPRQRVVRRDRRRAEAHVRQALRFAAAIPRATTTTVHACIIWYACLHRATPNHHRWPLQLVIVDVAADGSPAAAVARGVVAEYRMRPATRNAAVIVVTHRCAEHRGCVRQAIVAKPSAGRVGCAGVVGGRGSLVFA